MTKEVPRAPRLLVGKAAAGEVSSFSRYGLVIKKGATNSESFARALEAINKKFGGAAEGQIKTFSGAIDQASNAFGDLQEEFGFIITQNPVLISLINQASAAFAKMGEFVNDNRRDIQLFVGQGLLNSPAFEILRASTKACAAFRRLAACQSRRAS